MLPVLWLESADTDLDDITSYIARFDIDAAERLWQRLRGGVCAAVIRTPVFIPTKRQSTWLA